MFRIYRSIQHVLTISLFLSCAMAFGQAQTSRIGRVAQQVEALRSARVTFAPIALVGRVAADAATEALWNTACRRAEVLRYDRSAAQRLIADGAEHIALTIPSAQGDVVLDLFRADVLTEDFVVREASTRRAVEPATSAHFRGSIRGQAGSIASVSVFPEEMMVLMSDTSGERIVGRFDHSPDDLLVYYHADDLLSEHRMDCGTQDRGAMRTNGTERDGQATTLRCVRWYWEVSHDIFLDKGSVVNASNYATALFNQSATIFANDGISVSLQEIFVWNVPSPYGGNNSLDLLQDFQQATGAINGDMGHLLDLDMLNGGVAANIGSICAPNVDDRLCYSGIESSFNNVPTYSWSVMLVSHEQGHLMGSFHTHACVWNGNNTAIDGCTSSEGECPDGPLPSNGGTIMSYCDAVNGIGINFENGFGPQPAQVIRDHVNGSSCLFSCGTGDCDSVFVTLSTPAGAATVLSLSVASVPLLPVAGEELALCLSDGCYRGTLTDQNGGLINGTYQVLDANAMVIASGSTTASEFTFTLGTPVNGCTDPDADNFDPDANCDDGTCCATHLTLVLSDSGGDGWEGAVYALVSVLGDTAFSGTLASGAGDTLTFCPPIGCYSFTVSAGSDPGEIAWVLSGEVNVSGGAETSITMDMGGAITGCMDPLACNYSANATCPGSCTYGEPSVIFISPSATPNDVSWTFVDPGGSIVNSNNGFGGEYAGCLPAACGYRMFMTDGAGQGWDQGYYAVIIGEDTVVGTLETGSFGVDTLNFGPQAGCMDPAACDYDALATCPSTCAVTPAWFADADGDGYGDENVDSTACTAPTGYVANAFDCDDSEEAVNAFASEICDGLDNDCNGVVDDGFIWYADVDEDGFGDDATMQVSCTPVPGGVQQGGDCDDADPAITGVGEECDDGDPDTHSDALNGDCVCEGLPIGVCGPGEIADCNGNCAPADWVGDGFCDNGTFEHNGFPIFFNCAQFSNDGGDCAGCTTEVCDGIDNDCDFEIDEGFVEVCNGLDDDCDGTADEGLVWLDTDGDGFGDPDAPAICGDPGSVANDLDCDDTDPDLAYGVRVYVLTEDDNGSGTAHYVITQGSTVIEGDMDLLAEDFGMGSVQVCLSAVCFSVAIAQNDAPLWHESYIQYLHDPENSITFSTTGGFQGPAQGLTSDVCNGVDDDCDGDVDEGCAVMLHVRAFLEGPYNSTLGTMSDAMRALGLVPTIEPYTGLGYTHVGGGTETTTPSVLAGSGNNAIVDWVVLELRDPGTPSMVVATRSALLQRDGDVVDVDGISPVSIAVVSGSYHVSVRHRNHLGAMTAGPVALSPTLASVDFTSSATPTFGTNARKVSGGASPAQLLWAGDVTFNHVVKYTGSGNDRDPILISVGSTTPNSVVPNTYSTRDVNLNGEVKYTGSGNDRDPILLNVGSTTPNGIRAEQLP